MAKSHCAECMKNDEDCCSSFYARFATLGDAQRIAKLLGKKPSAFLKYAELSKNDKGTNLYAKKPHGYYYDLVSEGKILQLRTKRNGSCIFFEKGSCRIYPSRPLACRIFPFWFSKGGNIIVDNNGINCPIVCGKKALNENPSEAEITAGIRKIGHTEKKMVHLISQLMKEIDEYKENINSFVKKNLSA
jgi:Fe-S-cluster containining protein